jgi:hypothetical protein
MSQNLTQPEEIDRALREMAGQDMKVDTFVANNKKSSEGARKDWGNGYVSSCRAAHAKPKQGLFDP